MAELVTYAVSDGIAHVRLNRPDKLNALTLDTLKQLEATARALRGDRTLRAVVISGEGASFCAGLDFASVLGKPRPASSGHSCRSRGGARTSSRRRAGPGAGCQSR